MKLDLVQVVQNVEMLALAWIYIFGEKCVGIVNVKKKNIIL